MKAKEFDKQFDEGKDISNNLDLSKSKRPGGAEESKRGFSSMDDSVVG